MVAYRLRQAFEPGDVIGVGLGARPLVRDFGAGALGVGQSGVLRSKGKFSDENRLACYLEDVFHQRPRIEAVDIHGDHIRSPRAPQNRIGDLAREARAEVQVGRIGIADGPRAHLKVTVRDRSQKLVGVLLVPGTLGWCLDAGEVGGFHLPCLVESSDIVTVAVTQEVDGLPPSRGGLRQLQIQVEHRLLAAPVRSPTQLVVAEVADTMAIVRARCALLLGDFLGGLFKARIEHIHRSAVQPVGSGLVRDVEDDGVRHAFRPQLPIRPGPNRVETPAPQPRQRCLLPSIAVGVFFPHRFEIGCVACAVDAVALVPDRVHANRKRR